LAADFKTIADFRRDNGAAVVGARRAFVLFCRDQGLFTAQLVALDGSKFRAAASAKRIIGRREIAQEAARLDRQISEYLAGLDESDDAEPNEAPSATAAALETLRAGRAELDPMASRLDAEGRNTLVEGETDAWPMGIGNGLKRPSYNVQPPSMPILASFSITRSQLSQSTIDCFIRWPLPPRMPSQSTRSPWLQTLATQMVRTQPPARVKGLRHAFRQIVRLTIKATGRSSTDPPSSISLRVTLTHVRRAAGWYANRSCAETIAFFTSLRTAPDVR
jgi:hypothetical protein